MARSVCEQAVCIQYRLLYILDTTHRSTASQLRQHLIILCYRASEQSLAHPSQLTFIKLIIAISRIAIAMVTVSSHAEAAGCV